MNLQSFIENTLVAIANGVRSAQKSAPGVSPLLEQPGEDDEVSGVLFTRDQGNLQPVFMVEFDVAVSADEKSASSVGGGIRVLEFVSGGAKRSSENRNATVSRIKFKIPLRLADTHQTAH
jgi:hypothetical protein